MTSANVSNLPIQAAAVNAPTAKAEKVDMKNQFLQVMSSSMKGEVKMETATTVQKPVDTSVKVTTKPNEIKSVENEPISDETVATVKEEVEQFAEDVKDVLQEELDVTEEEIVEAMEALGLVPIDLMDTTHLAELVSKLTDCESNASLLVDGNFTDILSQVNDLAQELLADTNMQPETLKEVMVQMDVVEPEVFIMPEDEMVETQMEMQVPETEVPVEQMEATEAEVLATDVKKNVAEEVSLDTTVVKSVAKEEIEVEQKVVKDEESDVVVVDQMEVETEDHESDANSKQNFSNDREPKFEMPKENHLQTLGNQTIAQFEPATGEVTLTSGETVNVREMMDQIVEAARTMITANEKTVEIVLNPEGLGKVWMEVTEKNGDVSAKIVTQNEEVKQALETQMIQLKEQLNQSGAKVNAIEVSVGTQEFDRNLEEGQQDRQQEEAQRQSEQPRTRNLNMNNLDELVGLMTEEEELVAKMMRDNGNTVNFTA